MKVKRKIIEIDDQRCDGCGQCAMACAEGAIDIIEGKARLVSESYCDGLGACIGECPQGAITIVEREAADFSPEDVEKHLLEKTSRRRDGEITCPSAKAKTIESGIVRNWPVKLKLVPEKAPFFSHANLLIVADCAPAVCSNFHEKFLMFRDDNVMLIGCPKFDNLNEYLSKLTTILRQGSPESIKVVRMEVPCCSGLTGLVKKAVALSNKEIPVEEVVLSAQGRVVPS